MANTNRYKRHLLSKLRHQVLDALPIDVSTPDMEVDIWKQLIDEIPSDIKKIESVASDVDELPSYKPLQYTFGDFDADQYDIDVNNFFICEIMENRRGIYFGGRQVGWVTLIYKRREYAMSFRAHLRGRLVQSPVVCVLPDDELIESLNEALLMMFQYVDRYTEMSDLDVFDESEDVSW